MSLKKTIILGLILAGLAFYILRVELPRDEQKEKEDQIFSAYSRKSIASVELSRGSTSFVIKNNNPQISVQDQESKEENDKNADDSAPAKDWELPELPGADLDHGSLNSLLTSLLDLKVGKAIPKEEVDSDLGVYGLREPAAKAKVKVMTAAGEKIYGLAFGKKNEYIAKRYLRISKEGSDNSEGEIYLINEGLYSAVAKDRKDFRKKNPIDFLDSDLRKIALATKETALEFSSQETKSEGMTMPRWKISSVNGESVSYLASDPAVSELTRLTRNLRATDFVDGEAAKPEAFGLDKPDLSLSLEFKEESKKGPIEAKLARYQAAAAGSKENEKSAAPKSVYLSIKDSSSLFLLEGDQIDSIAKPFENFREKRIFRFPADKVTKVEVKGPGANTLTLEKEGGNWRLNGDAGDPVFINQFLEDLARIEAERFLKAGEKPKLDNPTFEVTLNFGDKAAGTLKVGAAAELDDKKEAKSYYACSHDCAEVFVIAAEALKKAQPSADKLRPVATPVPAATAEATAAP
ncbi:MAG: hypothetical protein DCC75_05390 [Proteobacteria bacterium]|nr:MAG: hypothetical protein DCC75_05390 [Pseudomonadota bacterium]